LTGGLVPPCGTEMAFVERVSEKSWEGEVWVIWDWLLAPPPQPEERKARINTESTGDTESTEKRGMARRAKAQRLHKAWRGCGTGDPLALGAQRGARLQQHI
jgi:hypothetical protein